ncbi:WXG100 family type VII secretion target [Actinophytocola sediminis]
MGTFEQFVQRALEARDRAVQAAQAAEQERRRRREETDIYVNGGVNWNGYGLEPLIKMVAERANPAQLDALAGEWSRHGQSVVRTSEDLRRSLTTLMQFWSGNASDLALQRVTNNVTWISELGSTAQQMSVPIQDAAGALTSAQDTMPGMPKNNWLGSAGGGAAAGFMVGGPIGAAFGAALGGIASAFGFGSSKKKLKRKAVQTMQRYEGALLGIDQSTPRFGLPTDGVNPGTGPNPNPGTGIDRPPGAVSPPGVGGSLLPRPGGQTDLDYGATDPAFAGSPEGRWQSLTGLGPNPIGGGGATSGLGGGGGLSGFGGSLGALPPGAMSGARPGALAGAGARGGLGAGARGGVGGVPPGMAGGRGGGDKDYRGRGRFNRGGGFGMGGVPGGRSEEERDGEHRRRVPIEDDPFATDLKAAPPVIGL